MTTTSTILTLVDDYAGGLIAFRVPGGRINRLAVDDVTFTIDTDTGDAVAIVTAGNLPHTVYADLIVAVAA